MRILRTLAAVGAAVLMAGTAHAADMPDSGFYVHGSLGAVQPNNATAKYSSYNPSLGYATTNNSTIGYQVGIGGTAGIGYRVNRILRLEAELDYGNSRVNGGGSVDLFAGYVAAYADIPMGGQVTPYVGGGLGFGQTRMAGTTTSGVSAFGEVGIGIAVTDRLTISPAARFLWLNNGSATVADSTAWMGRLGVRWSF